jgi:hypothetical protein
MVTINDIPLLIYRDQSVGISVKGEAKMSLLGYHFLL